MQYAQKEPPEMTDFHTVLLRENSSLPITKCVPLTRATSHLYENGVSHLLPHLNLTVHSEIEECSRLWQQFSPKESLFDLWDFRFAWHEGYAGRPYFYTIYDHKKPLAVLPLWYDPKELRFTWFGTEWMEDNKFGVADPDFIELLLAVVPSPLHLNAVESIENKSGAARFAKIEADHPKNKKTLRGISSMADLLKSFTKKHRYNIRADHRKLLALDPQITQVSDPGRQELEELITLNKKRFDGVQKEESAFYDEQEVASFHNIIKSAHSYKVKFIKVYIKGELISSDMIATYNNIYYPIRGGNNVSEYKGIGNFMMYLEFEDALRGKFEIMDCLQEDNGWKHRFFEQAPAYLLKK